MNILEHADIVESFAVKGRFDEWFSPHELKIAAEAMRDASDKLNKAVLLVEHFGALLLVIGEMIEDGSIHKPEVLRTLSETIKTIKGAPNAKA